MEMSQIRYFLAVSETLNFTRAAEQCFISQPALTKGIKKLEASIGGELLHRTKNSVELSFLGQQLLPNFRQIYKDANHAKEEAKRLTSAHNSVIRIGIQSNVFIGSILPIFQGYQLEHASVIFEFVEDEPHQLKSKLDSHELTLVFLSSLNEPENGFRNNRVYSENFVVACGDLHPFAGRHSITGAELHQQRYCYRTHCSSSKFLSDQMTSQGIHLNVVHSSSHDDWVRSFVRSNFGVAFLPRTQAISESLNFVELSDMHVSRSVAFEACSEIHRSRVCQQFIDALPELSKAYCRQLQIIDSMTKVPTASDVAHEPSQPLYAGAARES